LNTIGFPTDVVFIRLQLFLEQQPTEYQQLVQDKLIAWTLAIKWQTGRSCAAETCAQPPQREKDRQHPEVKSADRKRTADNNFKEHWIFYELRLLQTPVL